MTRTIIAYKNFAAHKNVSHIGLGVAGINNTKVLRREGNAAEVWPIVSADDLHTSLASAKSSGHPVTHVVISAPWIPTAQLQRMLIAHPDTQFAVNCHSNVGFLQADPQGVQLVREGLELQRGTHNFHVAGNSLKFCRWLRSAFAAPCLYLPNLYYLDNNVRPNASHPVYQGGTLRIGAFGATRPLKNFLSAAGAALEIARKRHTNMELWISAGRSEGGDTILHAARAMYRGLPHVRLVENGWQSWPQFRQTVSHMHLLLQPSYTESFNMVTADGVAEGIPSVVSSAIDWAPRKWRAEIDDVCDMTRVGLQLLADPDAARHGWHALQAHNRDGLAAWNQFLQPTRRGWLRRITARWSR